MLKKISRYFFKSPYEIGLVNYLVLVFCFMAAMLGIVGTIINISLGLGASNIILTISSTVIFTIMYFYSWKKERYVVSKYIIIIIGIILLNVQWFLNYGSTGPILYLFVVVESFIIVFFSKREKFVFSGLLFINVTMLFYIEYKYPELIGKYESNSIRLFDLYTGLLIYLVLSILLLNVALKFYIHQQEKAELSDRLKTAFLANMSHEIRTPMNGILGFAEILKKPNLTGDEQQECVNIIERSGKRMLSIINDIIDISKIESGLMKLDVKSSNINEQIEYLYTFFKPETDKKGIQLSIKNSLPSKEAVIVTDHEKLYAILVNLVKNAIKYTDHGSIEFGYNKRVDTDPVHLEFYVKDTGIGIPMERQEAIFERFIQADISDRKAYQGAGLGLSISKAYVEMLEGKISVESKPDNGTTFYFTIPYRIEPQVIEKTIHSGELREFSGSLKVLIVEDDEASEMLLTREIKSFSREILTARNGLDAVLACHQNGDIDLVLMDIKIPGINGYEAAAQIREFNKHVIIIAQTAYALTGDKEKALEAGCNDYISKPIHSLTLKALISEHFKDKSLTE